MSKIWEQSVQNACKIPTYPCTNQCTLKMFEPHAQTAYLLGLPISRLCISRPCCTVNLTTDIKRTQKVSSKDSLLFGSIYFRFSSKFQVDVMHVSFSCQKPAQVLTNMTFKEQWNYFHVILDGDYYITLILKRFMSVF